MGWENETGRKYNEGYCAVCLETIGWKPCKRVRGVLVDRDCVRNAVLKINPMMGNWGDYISWTVEEMEAEAKRIAQIEGCVEEG